LPLGVDAKLTGVNDDCLGLINPDAYLIVQLGTFLVQEDPLRDTAICLVVAIASVPDLADERLGVAGTLHYSASPS